MKDISHLKWLGWGLVVGFAVPFVFADLLTLPLDLYYLVYILAAGTFLAVYVRSTGMDLKAWFSRRLGWGIALGVVFGALLVRFVLTNPATETLGGAALVGAIFWRGLAYGAADGFLLSVFPWVVTWRAFGVAEKPLGRKFAYGVLAWVFILVMTAAYHAGYADFRSPKMVKPLVGNTLISVPTLLSGNPVGAPITHAMMHVTAVVHCPKTDVFLPPHRD